MKFLILAALALGAQTSSAHIQPGLYEEPTATAIVGYKNAEDCYADNGDWQEGLCVFKTTNTVELSGQDHDSFKITINVVGGNAHMCFFEEFSTQVTPNAIISEVETEVYRDGKWEPATCTVTVGKVDENSVNVTASDNCQNFCGARAWLYVDKATRVK